MWWLIFIPNLLLAVDCAIHRRDLTWFFLLGFLGPIGAISYLVYFWESITFPFAVSKLVKSITRTKSRRRCPHCGKWVDRLESYTDGRQERLLCEICRDHLAAHR